MAGQKVLCVPVDGVRCQLVGAAGTILLAATHVPVHAPAHALPRGRTTGGGVAVAGAGAGVVPRLPVVEHNSQRAPSTNQILPACPIDQSHPASVPHLAWVLVTKFGQGFEIIIECFYFRDSNFEFREQGTRMIL